ncbi:iron transporter [Methylobacterium sp. NEAU 140]|uniref:iron transporter n=1 Tax=Methylobacterium sp. NEAU 140 TaxID=3064945 RepID=UPI002736C1F4|nr:iron transporter [Methylobacterium sp. NEAU 140]MDP4025657.1 iron transporter [Methylobacterium sp. NEAU 140]
MRPAITAGARAAVAARVAVAVLGGYAVAAAATACLALALPLAPADATTTATMLSFAVYAAAVLWAFSARRLAAAALGLLAPALALGALAWLLHGGHG